MCARLVRRGFVATTKRWRFWRVYWRPNNWLAAGIFFLTVYVRYSQLVHSGEDVTRHRRQVVLVDRSAHSKDMTLSTSCARTHNSIS
jgi:hypothetical protein